MVVPDGEYAAGGNVKKKHFDNAIRVVWMKILAHCCHF